MSDGHFRRGSPRTPRKHTAARLEPGMLDRLEALAAVLSTPSHALTLSEVVRVVINRGLDEMTARKNDGKTKEMRHEG